MLNIDWKIQMLNVYLKFLIKKAVSKTHFTWGYCSCATTFLCLGMFINTVPDDCLMYIGFNLISNITSIVNVFMSKHRKKDVFPECIDTSPPNRHRSFCCTNHALNVTLDDPLVNFLSLWHFNEKFMGTKPNPHLLKLS